MNSIRALLSSVFVVICMLVVPSGASAATCSDTWKSAAGGNWNEAANWSAGLPAAGSDVCIEKPLTVTVPTGYALPALDSLDVGSETVSGTATLEITIAERMKVNTATIGTHGAIDLDGTYNGANAGNATLGGGTIANRGTIEMKGNGYRATLYGTIVNEGTISNPFGGVVLGGEAGAGGSLDNKGTITVGPTPANDEAAGITDEGFPITDDTGGSIVNEATFYVKSAYDGSTVDGAYIQGNGTETGNPIEIGQSSSLAYSGSGASSVKVVDSLPMTGSLSAGQNLQVGIGTVITEPSSFTNAGSILLNGNYYGGGGGPAEIALAAGTFTNTGTLTAESNDNDPTLSGNFVNSGTVSIAANTQLEQAAGTFTNAGGGTFAPQISKSSFGEVRIDSEASFLAGGTLAPTLLEGFLPSIGQEFHVVGIRGGSWSGRFAAIVNGFGVDYSNSGYIGAIYGGGVIEPTSPPSPSPGPGTTPVAPPIAQLASLSGAAGAITVKLSCPAGAGSCASDSILASVTEHLKHGKLTAVSAGRATKVVAIASGSASVKAGSTATVKLALNRTGQTLLKRYRSLAALVTVTSAGKKLATATVHIHEPVKRHKPRSRASSSNR